MELLKGNTTEADSAEGLDVATEVSVKHTEVLAKHKETESGGIAEDNTKDSNMETMIVTETDDEVNIDDIETDDDLDSFVGQFKVGEYKVRNVKSAKTSMAKNTRVPKKLTEACKLFTPTTLNNKIMFIAMNARSKTKHSQKQFGSKFCGLSPVCGRKWEDGEIIARVYVFRTDFHIANESEVWVCNHHVEASIGGYELQIQSKIVKVSSNTIAEIFDITDEDERKEVKRNRMSLRKKKKSGDNSKEIKKGSEDDLEKK